MARKLCHLGVASLVWSFLATCWKSPSRGICIYLQYRCLSVFNWRQKDRVELTFDSELYNIRRLFGTQLSLSRGICIYLQYQCLFNDSKLFWENGSFDKGFVNNRNQWETLMEIRTVLELFLDHLWSGVFFFFFCFLLFASLLGKYFSV